MPEYGSPEGAGDWAMVAALAVALAAGIIALFSYMNIAADNARDACTAKGGTIVSHSRGLCVSPDGRILP